MGSYQSNLGNFLIGTDENIAKELGTVVFYAHVRSNSRIQRTFWEG